MKLKDFKFYFSNNTYTIVSALSYQVAKGLIRSDFSNLRVISVEKV
jgi:hypothetical protein